MCVLCVCVCSLSAFNFAVSCLDTAGSCIHLTYQLLNTFLAYKTYLNFLWIYGKNVCN